MTEETVEMIDTSKLQLQSLIAFAQCLDYQLIGELSFCNKIFYSSAYQNKARKYVSVNTMVEWYNKGTPSYYFNDYQLARAEASKIVKEVHIQYSKKKNMYVTQKHWVKFMNFSYENLFLH